MYARVAALLFDIRSADQSCFARHGNAFSRAVRQLSVGAAALFVFAARHAFRAFRSAVLAGIPCIAVRIRDAFIRFASVCRRECSRRARIVAVVVGGTRHTFAGVRAVERIARTVRTGISGTAAFFTAQTSFARTIAADVLPAGTADVCGANAFPIRPQNLFAGTAATCPRRARFAFSVRAFFGFTARCFRAFAGMSVVGGFTVGRFTRTCR